MHPSAHAQMALSIERYMKKDRRYRVLDFGSGTSLEQKLTHRSLLEPYDTDYVGVDVREGNNIDVVMPKPYRVPLKSQSFDVVLSGQVFEHVPFFWASLLEIARVMKPRAYFFMTLPSRGHTHSKYDCWRVYPDGMRAMAAWARLELVEAFTDFPPVMSDRRHKRGHDFANIDREHYYWGDSVGVFRKPRSYPAARAAILRKAVLLWANRVGDLELTPATKIDKRRRDILGTGQDDSEASSASASSGRRNA
jgi:SAM-dependent methyltransferase